MPGEHLWLRRSQVDWITVTLHCTAWPQSTCYTGCTLWWMLLFDCMVTDMWQIRAQYTSSSRHLALHRQPVKQRIIFKIAVLAFNCVRHTGPGYFNDICIPLADNPGRFRLRPADRGDLLVPSTKTKNCGRSFIIAAPTVWNSQSLNLRDHSQRTILVETTFIQFNL